MAITSAMKESKECREVGLLIFRIALAKRSSAITISIRTENGWPSQGVDTPSNGTIVVHVKGFIDYASLTEVANSFRFQRPADAYLWAKRTSHEVTCALIHGHHFSLAPSPSGSSPSAIDAFEHLILHLGEFVGTISLSQEISQRRLLSTQRWAERNTHDLGQILSRLSAEDASLPGVETIGFNDWLRTALSENLTMTSLHVNGLFDLTFLNPIARILGVSRQELKSAWERTKKIAQLPKSVKDNPFGSSELDELIKNAFVASLLLRGRFRDYVARDLGVQVMHHRVRLAALPLIPTNRRIPYSITNVERCLGLILWGSAFQETTQIRRVHLWVENVKAVRAAVLTGRIDCREKIGDGIAVATAVKAAREAGVRTRAKWVDAAIDACFATGAGILTSFVLGSWKAFATSMVVYAASTKGDVGSRIAATIFERPRRLANMAETGGRMWGCYN